VCCDYVTLHINSNVVNLAQAREIVNSVCYNDSLICVIWLIHVCDMTHSYVWYDSSMCVIWLIHMCDMTHSYVWHVSSICDVTLWYKSFHFAILKKSFGTDQLFCLISFIRPWLYLGFTVACTCENLKKKKKKNWRYVRHVSRERVMKMWRCDHLKIRACVKIWRDKCEKRKSEDMCVTSRTWISHENVKM